MKQMEDVSGYLIRILQEYCTPIILIIFISSFFFHNRDTEQLKTFWTSFVSLFQHLTKEEEVVIADGGYWGFRVNEDDIPFYVPYRKPQGRPLTPQQIAKNEIQKGLRGRVENYFSHIKQKFNIANNDHCYR